MLARTASPGRTIDIGTHASLSDCFPRQLVPGHKYPTGVEILTQGEIANDVWIVDKGIVKLIHVAEDGRDIVVGLRTIGWIVGAASAIVKKPSPITAVTVTSCDLQRIDAGHFLDLLSGDSELSRWLHKMHSQEVFDEMTAVIQLTTLP